MEMFLTVEQAAERLQVTPYTVREHLKAGLLRGIKRGRLWRVPESALGETAPEPPKPKFDIEKRRAAIKEAYGSMAHLGGSVDSFLAEKRADVQREIERENQRQAERENRQRETEKAGA